MKAVKGVKSVIKHLSLKGLGVFKFENKTYFLKNTFPGDEILFLDEKNYQVLTPSPDRINPEKIPCLEISKGCQGCPWMLISYEKQLEYKTQRLYYLFEKMGRKEIQQLIKTIIPSPHTLSYRNRCQFKLNAQEGELGFVGEDGNIISIHDCPVLCDSLQDLLKSLWTAMPEMAAAGKWTPPADYKWVFLDVDDETACIPQTLPVCQRRPFKQGNNQANLLMKKWLREKLEELRLSRVVELYAGSGNFSEVIASISFTERLDIFEVQVSALLKMQSLEILKRDHVFIHELDLSKKDCFSDRDDKVIEAELLIIDPPREGFHQRKMINRSFPNLKALIYISCELDSFSRDAVYLMKKGWEVVEVQPLDQFPHTSHVEVLSVFIKK